MPDPIIIVAGPCALHHVRKGPAYNRKLQTHEYEYRTHFLEAMKTLETKYPNAIVVIASAELAPQTTDDIELDEFLFRYRDKWIVGKGDPSQKIADLLDELDHERDRVRIAVVNSHGKYGLGKADDVVEIVVTQQPNGGQESRSVFTPTISGTILCDAITNAQNLRSSQGKPVLGN